MKKFLLLSMIVASASAFAADDLLGELQSLQNEYASLTAQEEARFNQEKAQAEAAAQSLAQNEKIYTELVARVERLKGEANTRFYKSEYETLASKYEASLEKLNKEMEAQRQVIADFQKIEQLREAQ